MRFISRFKNQRRIHRKWASVWTIIKMAWIQRKKPIIKDIPIGKIEDIN